MENENTTMRAASGSAEAKPILVGIGASAGGLTALKTFFGQVPDEPGVCFVVVVHLSPQHESHLAELLQPHCRMPVQQVGETVELKTNHVYVIPPGANLNTIDSHLRLSGLEKSPRQRATIDHFFRTLAETHDGRAIGVILTGTGSDGTLGLRRIKEEGGVTIVQSPEEAEHDGMPRSALVSGVVDLVLPVAEIPREIMRLAKTQPRLPVMMGDEIPAEDEWHALHKILSHLHSRTGHDFGHYKRSTILRRIRRRMQLHQVETLGAYLELVQAHREEAGELDNDLLITVTEFFRDTEVFNHLQQAVLPRLFHGSTPKDRLRVWSVGCSTGEEAYSLAMLFLEESDRHEAPPAFQIFASDLHEGALGKAREGVYPLEIAVNLTPERLHRFFTKEGDHYRVRRAVRELMVFAPHNLLGDPPFSRLDLIVCRNLLIYLKRDIQQDVIRLFHYALGPEGLLLLGSSETVDRSDLFLCEHKDVCLYRRRNVPAKEPRVPFPLASMLGRGGLSTQKQRETMRDGISYGALHERIVERYGPPSVLVNAEYEVVHSSANSGRFMQMRGGSPSNQLGRLVREPLRAELRAALYAAREQQRPVRSEPVALELEGKPVVVVISVSPAQDPELTGFFLVLFEERASRPGSTEEPVNREAEGGATVHELRAELDIHRQRLQTAIEDYEASREEMQASNEELQSANEELRSTLEELETSKEELQSMNEELTTLNQENRHRVEELSQLTNDLTNFLAATDIATLFLDLELRILRFTPRVTDIINVRPSDRGRPLSDLTHSLEYSELQMDARRVLEQREPVEREVRSQTNQWYLCRMLPYRAENDQVQGAVITLVDITRRKRAEDQLEQRVRERTLELQHQTRRLRQLARQLATVERRERKRLAAVLHDELQQYLIAMKMRLEQADLTSEQSLHSAVGQALKLVDQTLMCSRTLTSDLRPPVLYEDGLAQALQWLARHMQDRHELKVNLEEAISHIDLDDDLRCMVFEGVRELLLNVVKHSGVRQALLEVRHHDGRLRVRVQDKGKGFNRAELESDKPKLEGFGLLNVRERFVAAGGAVAVNAAPGSGCEVVLELPLDKWEPEPTQRNEDVSGSGAEKPSQSRGQGRVVARAGTIRVLVVDDHDLVREGLIHSLHFLPEIEVVGEARDGEEALTAVVQFQPDVVLMDVNMPRLNGIEATRSIRKQHPQVRIIGLSVQDDSATEQSMVRAGASGFVSKAQGIAQLIQVVTEVVARPG
jgi:two-component system, chemotaxis family, CheB/CheR fusion protein